MTRHTRVVLYAGYLFMALWLLIAGARRVAIELAAGRTDWSPFVSGGIGLLALVLAIPAGEEILRRRRDP